MYMRKVIHETLIWGVVIFVLLLILNVAGLFKADFKDYNADITTELVSNDLVDDDKYRALVFNVENSTDKRWRWIEYSLVLRIGNNVVYSTHSIENKWELDAQNSANLAVKVPAFDGEVETEFEIGDLRERSIFK